MPDMTILIETIKEIIGKYEQELAEIDNNSSIDKYKSLIESLRNDITALSEIDTALIDELLSESNLSPEQIIRLKGNITTYRKLLLLNKTGKTSFKLSQSQIQDIINLCIIAEELEKSKKEQQTKNKESSILIKEKIKSLEKILADLKDNGSVFITDISLIESTMKESGISIKKIKEILYLIMEYNQATYNKKMQENLFTRPEKINIEEVRNLFKTFEYDFDSIKEVYQNEILMYASINNMRDIFSCLKELSFPRLNLQRDGKKLACLLICSDRSTIEDIVEYSTRKGIRINELLNIVPALISQNRKIKQLGVNENSQERDTCIVTGRAEDFKRNIEFLESVGFDTRYIYDTCKILLTKKHSSLVSNYILLQEYGIEITKTNGGELVHPALSCLISPNFSNTLDTFIEICPLGHRYIMNNMSGLTAFAKPENIVFFNILASYQDQDELGEYVVPEGPFNKNNTNALLLRDDIKRKRDYKDIPYRGVTEENKYERTFVLRSFDIQNQNEYKKAVEEAKYEELYDLTLENEELESLEVYTDKDDSVRYNFDGVLISKPKVKRIYNILINKKLSNLEDSLLYAITYNSLLTAEQFDKVKRIIKSRSK